MTVLLRVWPLGKEGEVSNGGTASEVGGRARPVRSLPATVIAREPVTAMSISTSGVRERQRATMSRTASVARIVMPTTPPRFVYHVTAWSRGGLRQATAWLSTGSSTAARPSASTTLSYTSADAAVSATAAT